MFKSKILDVGKYFVDPKARTFVEMVQKGDAKGVKIGLESGISPNVLGLDGFRPIHFAIHSESSEVLEILLKAGADPNAKINKLENTPLHYAIQSEDLKATEILLKYKADPNAKGGSNKPIVFVALDSPIPEKLYPILVGAGANLEVQWGGYTLLQSAMVGLQWKAAIAILENKMDLHIKNARGESAADIFCDILQRLKPTLTNQSLVRSVGDSLISKGIKLTCSERLDKFKK